MQFRVASRLFSSADVEAVTGVPGPMQRDWRRHAYLPSHGGKHSRYSASELSLALAMKTLTDLGLGPSRGFPLAKAAAPHVLWYALEHASAWDLTALGEHAADFESYHASDGYVFQYESICGIRGADHRAYGLAFPNGEYVLTSTFDLHVRDAAGGSFLNLSALGTVLSDRGGPMVVVSPDPKGGSHEQQP